MAKRIAELSNSLLGTQIATTDYLPISRPNGIDYKMLYEEVIAGLSEYFAELDEDGHIVGPIVVSTYANNTAAGTPASGTIFLVAGELRVGDGATQGGIPYLTSTPEFAFYSTDTSVALDINKSGITSFLLDGAGTDLTITNISSLPLGYKFDVVIYATTGQTIKIKIGGDFDYDQVSLTAGADGYYAYTFIKVTQALGPGDLVELSYKFTAL
jgi:hypothetical protein